MTIQPAQLFAGIPATLRDELFEEFRKIERNFVERRWEQSELSGGKLCEIVYSILKGHVDGNFPQRAYKPGNMVVDCNKLAEAGKDFPRSIRIQIPRMLIALYEIRNNRGVGHVGGDVNPDHMDAVCVLHMAKWVMAELVRIFHDMTTVEATAAVESLSERELTILWRIDGVTRVLDTSLTMMDQTLLLLYGAPAGLTETELLASVEHSNAAVYRRDVLRRAHGRRWIEYNETTKKATISPTGSKLVEDNFLP